MTFLANVARRLTVSADANNVGVVIFSNTGELLFGLNTYTDPVSLSQAFLSIEYPGANTNTSGGLYITRSQLFTVENGDRPNIRNVAIVITDGKSTFDSEKTIPIALDLQNDGVDVVAIGITDSIDEAELRDISSPPKLKGQNYFTSPNFQQLEGILDGVLVQACVTTPPIIAEQQTTTQPCKCFEYSCMLDYVKLKSVFFPLAMSRYDPRKVICVLFSS